MSLDAARLALSASDIFSSAIAAALSMQDV